MPTNPWKTKSTEVVYDNPWIEVTHREVVNPSGGDGIYGMVHFKNLAVGIIVLDEEMHTYLIGQYRYPTDQYSWEIPEGGGSLDIDPLESAKRELLEETGIIAKDWKLIAENIHLSNSVSDEVAILYLARDLSFTEAMPEDTEELIVKRLPFEKVVSMTLNNEIQDSMSIIAVLKLKHMLENEKL